jgi:hypothetical protein
MKKYRSEPTFGVLGSISLVGVSFASVVNPDSLFLEYAFVAFLAIMGAIAYLKNTMGQKIRYILAVTVILLIAIFITEINVEVIKEDKFNKFIIVFMVFGIVSAPLFTSLDIIRKMPIVFFICAITLALLIDIFPYKYARELGNEYSVNPIWSARIIGLGVISFFLLEINGVKNRYVVIGFLFYLIKPLLLLGSKGPFVASILSIAVMAVRDQIIQKNLKTKWYYIGLLFGFFTFTALVIIFAFYTDSRLLNYRVSEASSVSSRVDLYYFSIYQILNNINGIGVGGFYFNHHIYPHN